MIIALIKFIIIIAILALVVAFGLYFTEPTSEFHVKVKLYVGIQLDKINRWLEKQENSSDDADDANDSAQGSMPATDLPEYDNAECDEKFGADFDYLTLANSVSYGGDSPEVAYTNGFQTACSSAASSRKRWDEAQTTEDVDETDSTDDIMVGSTMTSTVSKSAQVFVDLIQGTCTDAEINRIATTYPETNNIDEYIKGVKDACESMTNRTLVDTA